VIARFPVDLLLENGDGTRDPDFHLLLAQADRRRISRTPARAGQVIRTGDLTVRILAPAPRAPGPPPADPNERAVVAIVSEGGFDLFLSADAESPSILPLRLPRVEAMKVPHHGSADPGLRRCSPGCDRGSPASRLVRTTPTDIRGLRRSPRCGRRSRTSTERTATAP
jgi:competence protein ComEC